MQKRTKLVLHRETVKELTAETLVQVIGGTYKSKATTSDATPSSSCDEREVPARGDHNLSMKTLALVSGGGNPPAPDHGENHKLL